MSDPFFVGSAAQSYKRHRFFRPPAVGWVLRWKLQTDASRPRLQFLAPLRDSSSVNEPGMISMLKRLSFLPLLMIFGYLNAGVAWMMPMNFVSAQQQAPKSAPKKAAKVPAKSTQKSGPTPQQLEAAKYFKEAEDLVGTAAENSDQQIALFQKALQLDPNLVAAAFNLGIIYTRLHDPLKALGHFGTVLQKAPEA